MATRAVWWGLAAVLLGSTFLRVVEVQGAVMSPFLEATGAMEEFNRLPAWRRLLPLHIGQGHYRWSVTGLVLTTYLDQLWGPKTTFVILTSFLTCVSFLVTRAWLRCPIAALTAAICMGFGTQFNYAYVNSSCTLYPIFVCLALVNAWTLSRLLGEAEASIATWVGFLASLISLALCWETWVNYGLFIVLLCGSLWYRARANAKAIEPVVRYVLCSTLALFVVYVAVRFAYGGEHVQAGKEGELVINYLLPHQKAEGSRKLTRLGDPRLVCLAVEDVVSNWVGFSYIALSNYFPPFLGHSSSLVLLGKERITFEQSGYHPEFTHLVYYHHLFLWYLFAGCAVTVFCSYAVRYVRAQLRDPATGVSVELVAILMFFCGCAVHCLIKYRPYMSVPVLTYKCILSILAVTLLIAVWMRAVSSRFGNWKGKLLIGVVWSTIVIGGWIRPAELSELAKHGGLSPFPDPVQIVRGWVTH